MTQDESMTSLLAFLGAMNKVQGLIEPVKKDSENPHFHNRYASLAAVNAAVMGPLTENGFVLLSGGDEIDGKPYLRTTLYHIKGHSETFHYPLTSSDNPQHISSSVTYARRVSLCALLSLSTEDDDGEAANAPVMTRTTTAAVSHAPEISGFELARFIPAKVEFVEGKGKGAGKMFCEIYRPDGAKFSGNEQQGELAQSAVKDKREIIVAFEKKGNYMNIKRDGVKLADAPRIEAEVAF